MTALSPLNEALAATRTMLGSCYEAFADNATSFSCGEIEMIADVYRAFDDAHAAECLLDSHCVDDDEGDEHYGRSLRLEAEREEGLGHTSAAAKLYEQADDWEEEQ